MACAALFALRDVISEKLIVSVGSAHGKDTSDAFSTSKNEIAPAPYNVILSLVNGPKP